jgi:hypothetical protein
MDLKDIGCEGVDWFRLAPDDGSVTGLFQHGNKHLDSIKRGEFLTS